MHPRPRLLTATSCSQDVKGYLSDRVRLRHRLVLWPAILSLVLWGCTAVAFSIHATRSSQFPLPLLSNATFTESKLPALNLPPIHAPGTYDRSKLAVIIEKRNLPVLIPVLLNFLVKVRHESILSESTSLTGFLHRFRSTGRSKSGAARRTRTRSATRASCSPSSTRADSTLPACLTKTPFTTATHSPSSSPRRGSGSSSRPRTRSSSFKPTRSSAPTRTRPSTTSSALTNSRAGTTGSAHHGTSEGIRPSRGRATAEIGRASCRERVS